MSRASGGQPALGNGTPEQVHLTWGDDAATSVVVSWRSPGRAMRPRVRIGQRVILAQEQAHSDEATGKPLWAYHARVPGLRPGAAYVYAITADNDANAADPFTSTFRTAPTGRAAFRFTCSGDLPVPGGTAPGGAEASFVAGAVESFQPLFHLLNGGLCGAAPAAPRSFGDDIQFSTASRPWMPVPGSQDPASLASYLARYALPPDGLPDSGGRWYSFRVGSVVFACLDSNDPAGEDTPDATQLSPGAGAQTRWLERTLARARADASVDWIIIQAHHAACSSSGSYLGVRAEWLPLLDRYSADLLLAGHGSGYERSFPCRGHDPLAGRLPSTGAAAETRRPHPVTQEDSGVFNTSQGTVHLTLGHALLASPAGIPGTARVHGPGGSVTVEHATWSARRDPAGGHGIAVFDVNPGTEASDQASLTVSYYRAVSGGLGSPADDFTELERFTLVRPRPGRRHHLHADAPPATFIHT